MATATTKTTPTIEIPELAQKIREQLLSTVQQGQQISVDGCADACASHGMTVPPSMFATTPGPAVGDAPLGPRQTRRHASSVT